MKEKKTEYLSFRTTKKVSEALNKMANLQDRSVSWVLNSLIQKSVELKQATHEDTRHKHLHQSYRSASTHKASSCHQGVCI